MKRPCHTGASLSWRRQATFGCWTAVMLSLLLGGSVAQASFPGRNGHLAFDVYRDTTSIGNESCSTANCQDQRIYSVAPVSRRIQQKPTCGESECQDSYPAWSADGSRLAFNRLVFIEPGNAEPTRVDLGIYRRGRAPRVRAEEAFEPAWAPGGHRIVFIRSNRLAVFSTRSGEVAPQRTGAGIPRTPDWSSRGTIVYSRYLDDGAEDLFALRPGGRPRRLTRLGDAVAPSWSPDGRQVVFWRISKPGLYVLSIPSGRVRRLTSRRGFSPVWSPDGKQIAFYRRRTIFTVRTDGSQLRRLYMLRNAGVLDHLSWQPLPGKRTD